MTNRRKFSNNHNPKIIKRVAAHIPCEPCMDLKHTPSFTETIMTVHKLTATQVPSWFHQRGHSIFPR